MADLFRYGTRTAHGGRSLQLARARPGQVQRHGKRRAMTFQTLFSLLDCSVCRAVRQKTKFCFHSLLPRVCSLPQTWQASSLWEVSLLLDHVHPSVANAAKLLKTPALRKMEQPIDKVAGGSYATIFKVSCAFSQGGLFMKSTFFIVDGGVISIFPFFISIFVCPFRLTPAARSRRRWA